MKLSIDWLLVFAPVAVLIRYVPAIHNDTWLFVVSGLAIVPLARWIGKATQELGLAVGPGLGGLLNATFGNAAELIIALLALHAGLPRVVKASITGSIIGNALLVLGSSILLGGIKRPYLRFNATAARSSATALLLASFGLITASVFHVVSNQHPAGRLGEGERHLSIAIGIVLIISYAALLLFSLKTHSDLFSSRKSRPASGSQWSKAKSIIILGVATAAAAFLSEFFVGTVETARQRLGLTEVFVGVVLIAIIGNSAEHGTAVIAALNDEMDLTFAVSIGSSLQIALFVAPVLIFASLLMGKPMDFEFTIPEVVAVSAAVLIVSQISSDGETNWLEGALLIAVYCILAVLFLFLPPVR